LTGKAPADDVPAATVAQAYKRTPGGDITGQVVPATER
jgi:hypothetical protein